LPEGTPRRVVVLSDDEIDRWRVGTDQPPQGVTMVPTQPPAAGEPVQVTLTGDGGTPGLPVTVRNLDRGSFRRVDADVAGGWSVSLQVAAGEDLELLRNRGTLAYLATLGAGIEVVDVDAFYGETPEDPQNPSLESDVLGIYTGNQDPNLRLCNPPVSDIGAALVDLGTLFDPLDPHPISLVGLVGFRGLALFESDPADVGDVSFYNEMCLQIGGQAQVAGMTVVEDYPFDFDADGRITEDEVRDFLVVTHRTAGLLILDATDRDALEVVGWVRLPGQGGHVSLYREGRLLYVSGLGGGLYVVDFDRPPTFELVDADGDGLDDRLVEVIPLEGNTNSPALVVPELGVVYAGGLDRGLTSVIVSAPRLEVQSRAGTSSERQRIDRLAPLGVPTTEVGGHELTASFHVVVGLPASAGSEVRLDLESLGPGGLPITAAGESAALAGLPQAYTGQDGLVLRRLSDQPWEEGYQTYRSDEVAVVADLRALRAYQRTAAEAAQCTRCDAVALGISTAAIEMPRISATRLVGAEEGFPTPQISVVFVNHERFAPRG
jgi:hypothetical protein